MYAYPEVKEAYGEKYELVKPRGAILSYPVTVMTGPTHINSFKNLLGRPSGEFTEDEINRYSLDRAASADSAPMFLWHTLEDKAVPVIGTLKLAAALTERGVPYKLAVYPYGPHGVALATELTECSHPPYTQPLAATWKSEADAWMRSI